MMFDYHISIFFAYVLNKKSYKHRTPYGGTLNPYDTKKIFKSYTVYVHIYNHAYVFNMYFCSPYELCEIYLHFLLFHIKTKSKKILKQNKKKVFVYIFMFLPRVRTE